MDGNSATRTHSLVLRQAQHERSHGLFTTRNFASSLAMPPPTQPFTLSITKSHTYRSLGTSQNANNTVRLELVERWTGTPQLAPIRSYFDRLSTNGATAPSPHESSHSASQCPPLNRSTGASQSANLSVRLEPHDTPTLPFALSLSKGERKLRNSHPFARTSTGSARTEPRPLHHTKFRIQPRNAPHSTVQPEHHIAPSSPLVWKLTKSHTYRSLGASQNANRTVRLELVER